LARKILLADDSVTAQNMGRRILSDAGYDVTTVNNGSAALKRIAESKPDLIVLDVYMPGYGGLEVCQRIRESDATARIPVLLTVGKLEPFKPDEARRVRADAFIVKPFEASELLAALTKLEDKIVPAPPPGKPGRMPKPIAAREPSPTSKEFGDAETGWKNRIKIPPPHAKPAERPEAEELAPPAPSPVEAGRKAAVPGDITLDEMAAIAAAAAEFSAQGDEAQPASKPVAEVTAKAEEPSVPKQDSSRDVESSEGGATFASAPEVQAEDEPSAPALQETIATPPSITELPVQDSASVPDENAARDGKLKHEEVVAALATLAPVHGNGADSGTDGSSASGAESVSSTADAGAGPAFSGPRWIAESVALSEAESTLILEQEMTKAQAAMAHMAAESAPPEPVAVATLEPPKQEEPSTVPLVERVAAQATEFKVEEPAAEMTPSMVAETVADTVAEQAATIAPETPAEEVRADVKEEAFAASAGVGSESVSTVDAVSQAAAPEIPAASTAEVPAEPPRETELAAAWASWKQIRESVVSPQVTSQVAEVAASGFKDLQAPAPTSSEESSAEAASQVPEENGAIASIVDSVLAELKPKLMQEIAKKMKKDK